MPVDRGPLIDAAVKLRAVSPAAWEDFLLAMRGYQAQLVGDMVRCDATMLVKAQGMAQMMTELTQTLVDAPRLKETNMRTRNG